MAEQAARALRPRKHIYYQNSQQCLHSPTNDQPEKLSSTKTPSLKDTALPAQQLHLLAKSLSKFINSANKKLLEKCNTKEQKDSYQGKNSAQAVEQTSGKMQYGQYAHNKKGIGRNEMKDNLSRNRSSRQTRRQQFEKIRNLQNPRKQRDVKKRETNPEKPVENMKNHSHQMPEFSTQQNQNINFQIIKKMQMEAAMRALQNQQILRSIQLRQPITPKDPNSDKVFKRSTFHIAIAYGIFLTNLHETGKQCSNPTIIDPTYPAKKVRGTYENDSTSNKPTRRTRA